MGMTAKVFIVLNLVVAIFFGTGSLVLYAKKVDWVGDLKASVDEANELYVNSTKEIAEITRERNTLQSQNNNLTKDAGAKENTIESLTAKNTDLNKRVLTAEKETQAQKEEFMSLQGMMQKKEQRTAELQTRLDDVVRRNTATVKKLEWYQELAIESQAQLKEVENEMQQLAKGNAELVRKVTVLTRQNENYRTRLGVAAGSDTVATLTEPINGRILQVRPELNLVILSVGLRDKVTKGMEFVVSRGDEYISKVRVANVYDDMCSAKVLGGMTKQGAQIKISDLASTLN